MAEQQFFVTGTDPEAHLYQMPQEYLREAVFAPGGEEEQPAAEEDVPAEAKKAKGEDGEAGK